MSRIVTVILIYHRHKPTDLNTIPLFTETGEFNFRYWTYYLWGLVTEPYMIYPQSHHAEADLHKIYSSNLILRLQNVKLHIR
jgi:hypothetical protein